MLPHGLHMARDGAGQRGTPCGTHCPAPAFTQKRTARDGAGQRGTPCGTHCPAPSNRQNVTRDTPPRLACIISKERRGGVGWDKAGLIPQHCMPARCPTGVRRKTIKHQPGNGKKQKLRFLFPSGAYSSNCNMSPNCLRNNLCFSFWRHLPGGKFP